ncbi:hypothetical protein TRFO_41967 [Tritrichomonas foetus]|uniref:Uncharacterized protein n=1 Tax=Tritrichomonas foetus TaxID=1144522 RepID=A0A1J4L2N2_9EUKA|nr:hypothetical protein TRFO_41967 [Tritrichomonas foetus]|eukprot:OHT16228.1 hypothetical protein TRFO_41967 [Tritrichomonas foetus]
MIAKKPIRLLKKLDFLFFNLIFDMSVIDTEVNKYVFLPLHTQRSSHTGKLLLPHLECSPIHNHSPILPPLIPADGKVCHAFNSEINQDSKQEIPSEPETTPIVATDHFSKFGISDENNHSHNTLHNQLNPSEPFTNGNQGKNQSVENPLFINFLIELNNYFLIR